MPLHYCAACFTGRTWLDRVDKVSLEVDIERTRQLAERRALGHLLDRHVLRVLVRRETELSLQEVPRVILRRVHGPCRHAGHVRPVAELARAEVLLQQRRRQDSGQLLG